MGPLAGIKVIEMAHIGPVPHCAMLLADLGATVLRIERAEPSDLGLARPIASEVLLRGRKAIALDLKLPASVDLTLRLMEGADALIEGFRPGTMERLGLGPDIALARNAKLVYGRMTGWGQSGPLSLRAGHDLNYLALSGALHAIGRAQQPPTPPLNWLGDYGGGSMFLAVGLLSAILEARSSGFGQVVDVAMIDGVASLLANYQGARQAGLMQRPRGENLLDSGAFFYDVYKCEDDRYLSIACIEEKFFRQFLACLGLDPQSFPSQEHHAQWEVARSILVEKFLTRSQAEWMRVFEGTDSCVAPVIEISDVATHPHHQARSSYVKIAGVVQPIPAPRFSRTKPELPNPPANASPATFSDALATWLPPDQIDLLQKTLRKSLVQ
jgi:alpha-methylacyl-CoA racemase